MRRAYPNEVTHSQWQGQHKGMLPHDKRDAPAIVKLYDGLDRPRQIAFVIVTAHQLLRPQKGAISLSFDIIL